MGTRHGRLALIEFPSLERLRAFWHAPEYAEAKPLCAGRATFVVRAAEEALAVATASGAAGPERG